MFSRRLVLLAAPLVLGFGLAATAQAQGTAYPLTGGDSGLQYHIGNGLALPIQPAIPNIPFPAAPLLLVPEIPGAWVQQTAGADPKAINIVYPVLSKPAAYAKVGVNDSNPGAYQVATNLSVVFPNTSSTVMFAAGGRTGGTTTIFTTGLGPGNKITYKSLAAQFGGPGKFFVGNPGTQPAGALFSGVNATVWANVFKGTGNPPCKHTAFGGLNMNCRAFLIAAVPDPTATGAPWGAAAGYTVMTPGGTPNALVVIPGTALTAKPAKGPEPGRMFVSAPGTPTVAFKGSIAASAYTVPTPTTMHEARTGLLNAASSTGYPWTTGRIVVSAPMAGGVGEKFTLTGMDTRVAGVGAIQLVTGTLSRRTITGPNANRAWLRLDVPEPSAVLGAACGLAMLALCHGLARRRSR